MRAIAAVLLLTVSFAGRGQTAVSLERGWNLLGNSTSGSTNVTTLFGTQDAPIAGVSQYVLSVWKWVVNPSTGAGKWAYFTPSLTKAESDAAALALGYDALSTINGGEGFWVRATSPFALQLPAGVAVTTANVHAKLVLGWNLVAIGDDKSPRAFNNALSATPPTPGVIPTTNFLSLWAWSAAAQRWYFYAPSLDAAGTLAGELANRGYLDFGTNTLTSGTGFWVNSLLNGDGKLHYPETVIALWTGKYPFKVTRTGATRAKNMTRYIAGGFDLFNCVISSYALADGRIPLLCKDGVEFKYHELYIDPIQNEVHEYVGTLPSDLGYTLNASGGTITSLGVKWGDVTGGDPIHGWSSFAKVADGWYFTLPEEDWVLKFQDNVGNTSVVQQGTFEINGNIYIMFAYSN